MVGPRFVHLPTTRHKISVRGQVIGEIATTTGRWFWKKTIPGIRVRISQEHWEALEQVLAMTGISRHVGREIAVYGNVSQFSVGQEVGITFGYSGQLEQFFQRAIPFQLLDVVPNPTTLPNEVRPIQPMLREVG